MPYSMVHFAISVEISELTQKPLSPEFLLGSISPDCIYIRKDMGNEIKDVTHLNFLSLKGEITDEIVFERMGRFLQTYVIPNDQKRTEFLAGYISHILADIHWTATVSREFRKQIPTNLSRREQWDFYQNEQNQIDFELYRTVPWKNTVWELLTESTPFELGNLIKSEDVQGWRNFLLEYFESDAEPKIIPTYITSERVHHFIGTAATYVIRIIDELALYK
ncbi:zinc dependent phospholipase C family protein [Cytobacillus sp. FJAT-54145]|uniref:Zinc dependent phospholipase C family protein n=1 Tax=Cytobacillus spartinae TaxID=3299023 RepID=A0ABW6KFM2_9BACI